MNGLKTNLLNIIQFCDENFSIKFSKDDCNVYDHDGKCLLKENQTFDNCYGIPSLSQFICSLVSVDMVELWHKRFGHINFKNLAKISKRKVVIRLPPLHKVK